MYVVMPLDWSLTITFSVRVVGRVQPKEQNIVILLIKIKHGVRTEVYMRNRRGKHYTGGT